MYCLEYSWYSRNFETAFFLHFVNVVMIQAGLGIRRSRELVRAFIVLGISAVLMAGILSLFRQYIRYGSLFFGCVIAGDYLVGGILWMLQQLFRKKFGTCESVWSMRGRTMMEKH